MAARGTEAKAYAVKKIAEAFGENFVGEIDKKVYINCPEAGGLVQIAISMTCPKTTVGPPIRGGGMDFEAMSESELNSFTKVTAEITEEETNNIKNLMSELNLLF